MSEGGNSTSQVHTLRRGYADGGILSAIYGMAYPGGSLLHAACGEVLGGGPWRFVRYPRRY